MEKKEKKFEEKIKILETIIDQLENGNIDLDESINKYSEAMQLIKECDQELKAIETKVTKIVSDANELEIFNEQDIKD